MNSREECNFPGYGFLPDNRSQATASSLRGSVATALLAALSVLFAILPPPLRADVPPVYLVLFTHIEDNTPAGTLGSSQSRQNYLLYRSRLIDMANLARNSSVPWSLQPDWKFLEAALLYEDASLTASTNNKNILRYLREDLGAVIDPHSHENGGYNYTDVAHLLDSLGVGGTTVIGGHIWDPSLPQFQEWDRFRVPVQGEHYPGAWWRGDILMGSGTPNHVNDPVVSGVWRPRDRDNYFAHDGTANIVAIGQYRGAIEDLRELRALYQTGAVSSQYMLTSSYHIKPSTLTRATGIASISDSVIAPVVAMRDSGMVVPTDFTSLVQVWQASFGSRGYLYYGATTVAVGEPASLPISLSQNSPNPCGARTTIRFSLPRPERVRLTVLDLSGREVARLAEGEIAAGEHAVSLEPRGLASGLYFYRLQAGTVVQSRKLMVLK